MSVLTNEEVEMIEKELGLNESHFKVGDEVKCKESGMEGEVVAVDDEEKGKYYSVKREDGKTVKYAPDELEKEDDDDDDDEIKESKMDPVDKKALKKDFEDRKDQDLDNDGDTDSSDKYLHMRRKAITKAINKEK
jgi:hypothetical protein